jgi:ABC-type spermidine/putrescine transport system permease subunit II
VSVLAVLLLGVESAGATQFQSASFGLSFLIYAGVLHALHGTSFGTSLLVSIVSVVLSVVVGVGLALLGLVCAGGLAAVG